MKLEKPIKAKSLHMNKTKSISSVDKITVEDFIEDARKKLIDSGTRNKLVHVNRKGEGKFLNIVNEQSDEIFKILYTNKKKMKFRATELSLETESDDEILFDLVNLTSVTNQENIDEASFTDKYLDVRLDTERLQKRLLMMARDARTAEEEQGINILFLALGFLVWFENDNSQVCREAPLLLLPVELIRNQRTSTYDVQARDEDILTNLSLQARLKEDFGLVLPEVKTEGDWIPSAYFKKVENAISHKTRWCVDNNGIQLGFFSFAKQLMLRDLKQNEWPENRLCNDKLIQQLLMCGFEEGAPFFEDGDFLDDKLPPQQIIHVVDADASQTKVIEEVRQGRHLVVQGPPGTGKSQTITNIIATAVHEGKTVLFMAEKMAALDVVLNRMKKSRLGDLCLELHSRQANKKKVLQEIGRTLNSVDKDAVTELSTCELKEKRDNLNRLAKLLHNEVPGSQFTPFEAISSLIGFIGQNCDPPTISCTGLEYLNFHQQEEIEKNITLVAKIFKTRKSRNHHPFFGVKNFNLDPVDQIHVWSSLKHAIKELNQILTIASKLLDIFRSVANDTLAKSDPTRWIISFSKFESYLNFISILKEQPNDIHSVIYELGFRQEIVNSLIDALATGVEWNKAKDEESVNFNTKAWNIQAKPIEDILRRGSQRGINSFFLRLRREYRQAVGTLDDVTVLPLPREPKERYKLAKRLLEIEEKRMELSQEEDFLKLHLTPIWRGEKTDFLHLKSAAEWVNKIREGRLLKSEYELEAIQMHKSRLSEIKNEVDSDLLGRARKAIEKVLTLLDYDLGKVALNSDIEHVNIVQLRTKFEILEQESSSAYVEWVDLQSAISKLTEFGRVDIIDLIERDSLGPQFAIREFRYACAEARWKHSKDVVPEMKEIASWTRHDLVQSFCRLDKEHIESTQTSIKSKHLKQLPKGAAGQMGIVWGEIAKKKNHMPIRKLISRAGDILQRIKPVFFMSPISIAQFLPPKALRFDLLVIDEASQVRPEDAIGAVARCEQIVVVGDQQQLPPTSFFERLESDLVSEEEEEETNLAKATEMESILTLCEARGVDRRMLGWHYRSRDPSLIYISNKSFYEGKLILTPSPQDKDKNWGMFFTKVPGVYSPKGSGEGRPGTNKIEAEFVAKGVFRHARENPSLSLGIVTFSKSQTDMITEVLERDRRRDEVLNAFLREDCRENCFVKNIENVQGDERDVIFISVGYGPTIVGGKLASMRFGPINSEGGERRLNVLFTRARFRCQIFASFDPEDIDSQKGKWPGPSILQQYLQFAKSGRVDSIHPTADVADSPFEEDVANVIRSRGFIADYQVGDSGFRIDLGVKHPENPSHYILAVECDGATYHSALSARERDRHRQAILEQKGWTFHRIWSTDWFCRRAKEIDRLFLAIEDAKNDPKIKAADMGANSDDNKQGEGGAGNNISDDNLGNVEPITIPTFNIPKYTEVKIDVHSSLKPHLVPTEQLANLVIKVVEKEGPVHHNIVARRIAVAYGMSKAGSKIRDAVDQALHHAKNEMNTNLVKKGKFWLTRTQLENPPIRNRAGASPMIANTQMLPPIEILAASKLVATESGQITREDLIREISRLLGFKRTGEELKQRIENVLNQDALSKPLVQRKIGSDNLPIR